MCRFDPDAKQFQPGSVECRPKIETANIQPSPPPPLKRYPPGTMPTAYRSFNQRKPKLGDGYRWGPRY